MVTMLFEVIYAHAGDVNIVQEECDKTVINEWSTFL